MTTDAEPARHCRRKLCILLAVAAGFGARRLPAARADITNAAQLTAAVNNGQPNATVVVAAGTFELTAPLRPKPGMIIQGAGIDKTIIKNATTWMPGNAGLDQDEGATRSAVNCDSYLFSIATDTDGFTLTGLTLNGAQIPGGICGISLHHIELANVAFKSFLWSGFRAFIMDNAKIHDNTFFDAGGKADGTTGSSGGGLFLTYTSQSEIHDNRFQRSVGNDSYGIKGREARSVHIFNNTIETDFAIEFPFENDYLDEIDHNYIGGTVSVPRYAGGTFPDGGYTFHAHHNYFKSSYSFEYQRNAVEVDHNLFDFALNADGGNLISSFDSVPAPGGTKMHDNLIHNPGRGIYWNAGVYNQFSFTNNYVKAATTVTPRTDGLFDFNPQGGGATTDWSTIVIRDNIFELMGTARPLMRNAASHAAVVENNVFTNISDGASYPNLSTGKPQGPIEPLLFTLGVHGEWTVDGWTLVKTPTADGGAGGTALPDAGAQPGTVNDAAANGLPSGSGAGQAGGRGAEPGGTSGTSSGNGGASTAAAGPSASSSSSGSCSLAHGRARSGTPLAGLLVAAWAILRRRRRQHKKPQP